MASSSSTQYSDNPNSRPPRSSLEMEFERDGVVRDSGSRLRSSFQFCHRRNLALVFLFVLALFIATTDIFESADMSLPDGDDDFNASPQRTKDDGDDLMMMMMDEYDDTNDGDEKGDTNVVDLNAYNPGRDGVEFISPSCNYTCRTDRLPHESALYPGQVLCSQMHRFGMTEAGDFVLQDCQLNKQTIFWSAQEAQLKSDQYPIHFEMQKNGYFQIISDPSGKVLFEQHPKRNVTYHHMCLHEKPKLDCPYLHLRGSGMVVLNWIDDDAHKWMDRDMKQQYVALFPADENGDTKKDDENNDDTKDDGNEDDMKDGENNDDTKDDENNDDTKDDENNDDTKDDTTDHDGDDDGKDDINVVDLHAQNPKRDGVDFISPSCNYTCLTDRLPQRSPLYPGQVLCSQMHRFGMTEEGELFLQDCQLDQQTIFWSAQDAQLTSDQYPIHFEMQKNGYFQIISEPSGKVLFEAQPNSEITFHRLCLKNPKLHCPYLHLHPDGVLVLNWIDDDKHKWMAWNVKQKYVGLFPP
ncbi:MAG: hypothetical protein SGBAC_010165 [Bacillariaceae sp.]